MTKRKKLSAQWIAQQIANSSADFQTKRNYLLNRFQHYLKDFKSDCFVFKKSKRN